MERATRVPALVFPAAGMSMLNGPTADNGKGYKVFGLSATRPGELSRLRGKIADGNTGFPIMSFAQFWSPFGYLVDLQQGGYNAGTTGTITGSTATISTSAFSHYSYSYGDDTIVGFYPSGELSYEVTLLTAGVTYADYSGIGHTVTCDDEPVSGSVGPIPGNPPYTYEVNGCSDVFVCGLFGRGLKIISNDGVETCFLPNDQFHTDLSVVFNAITMPTWRVLITDQNGAVVVDVIVPSLDEPVVNL